MKHRATVVLATMLALGLPASLEAYAAPDASSAAKHKSGDGDTGFGDRPAPLTQQQPGSDERTAVVSKQKTGEGDTGYGDRPNQGPFGSDPTRKP